MKSTGSTGLACLLFNIHSLCDLWTLKSNGSFLFSIQKLTSMNKWGGLALFLDNPDPNPHKNSNLWSNYFFFKVILCNNYSTSEALWRLKMIARAGHEAPFLARGRYCFPQEIRSVTMEIILCRQILLEKQ